MVFAQVDTFLSPNLTTILLLHTIFGTDVEDSIGYASDFQAALSQILNIPVDVDDPSDE